MKYKIIALKYEILEIKDYKENEFLELSLGALEEEINSLLTKFPDKRDKILLEAQIAKEETIKLHFANTESINQMQRNIQTISSNIESKTTKLEAYKKELLATNNRLEILQVELNKIPSYQARISQITNKIALLKKIEMFLSSFPSFIQPYLKNTYSGAISDIGEVAKDFYRKTATFTISAPFLYQYSREDVLRLFMSNGKQPYDESLTSTLLSDEEKDFAWMTLVYLERYPVIEMTKDESEAEFHKIGLTPDIIQKIIASLYKEESKEFELEVWKLMKPIKDWPEHYSNYLKYLYESVLTNDGISNSIDKAKRRHNISDVDAEQINDILKDRIKLEIPILLRLNIQLLVNKFIEFLQKERAHERSEMQRLEDAVKTARRQGINITSDIFKQAEEAKEHTIDALKNYYPRLIPLLTEYSRIVYQQASNRYEETILPSLEKITALIKASIIEQEELQKNQINNNNLQKQKNELIDQITGLNMLIQSITTELKQDESNCKTLQAALLSDINNYDKLYPRADAIRNAIRTKLTKKIFDTSKPIFEVTPTILPTSTDKQPTIGIPIKNIKLWEDLKEETIYSVKNEQGARTLFMFSKNVLSQVSNNDNRSRFLKAASKGTVSPTNGNGIKYMKEKQTHNYEIKFIGTEWRIFGTSTTLDNQEIIIFDSFETH